MLNYIAILYIIYTLQKCYYTIADVDAVWMASLRWAFLLCGLQIRYQSRLVCFEQVRALDADVTRRGLSGVEFALPQEAALPGQQGEGHEGVGSLLRI